MMTAEVIEFETLEMAEARIALNCERRAADTQSNFEAKLENKLLLAIIHQDGEYQRLKEMRSKLSRHPLDIVK